MSEKFYKYYDIYDDKVYSIKKIWEFYKNSTKKKTIAYYKDRIYCPGCHKARLTLKIGNKLKYLSVNHLEQGKHADDCEYAVVELSGEKLNSIYQGDSTIIRNKLELIVSNMLKEARKIREIKEVSLRRGTKENLLIKKDKRNTKNLPSARISPKILEGEVRKIPIIYYGEVQLYILKGWNYYLKILDKNGEKVIFNVVINKELFEIYLKSDLKNIPIYSNSNEAKGTFGIIAVVLKAKKDENYSNISGNLEHQDFIFFKNQS